MRTFPSDNEKFNFLISLETNDNLDIEISHIGHKQSGSEESSNCNQNQGEMW